MENNFYKSGRYLGADSEYQGAKAVIYGAPMDFTVSFRPGTRFGPEKIRSVSVVLEEYSPYQDKHLEEIAFYDAGDLALPFGNVEKSLQLIYETTKRLHKDNKFPILLGGEHLVSLPSIQATHEHFKNLKIIQFDAHADLREDYEGEPNSHATVIRKAAELIGGSNVFQLGIRSGTREEFSYGRQNTNFYFNQVTEPIDDVIQKCGNDPVYITLDIDVFDPAFAPGTGTPEPGGFSVGEILNTFTKLDKLNVIGFDLVEVSPVYDQSDITSVLAAKLVRETLLGFVK
ncbi:MAG: agmatinase [Desulfitibacter sp. BRH_c19]|nr:MAG: agmatinase [Desulfitibacter sp. BRH_c19]